MKRLTVIISLLSILLTGCQSTDEMDFMILYTTQQYGNVLPWDFNSDTVNKVSLANFMSLVKEQRSIYGDRCIVLDNGNMHTRGLSNFYWRYIDTICEPFTYKAQRYIGYDAVALGYSDIRLPEVFESKRHDVTQCPPTICTNIVDSKTGEQIFRPWICFDRQGVRLAIFALVDENADGWTPELGNPDAHCEEMISSLRTNILKLHHECHPDVVIGIISTQTDLDKLNLTKQIPGLDHVIGINFNEYSEKRQNQYAGMLRLHLKRGELPNTFTKQAFTATVDLAQYEIDRDYTQFFADDIQHIRDRYKEELGYIPERIWAPYGIYSAHDHYRDILHQAHLWYSGADISLANIANDTATIEEGPVNIRRITEIFAHENLLITFKAKGQEVKDMLESFYNNQYNKLTSPNDQMLALRYDAKGHQMWDEEGHPYLKVAPARFTSGAGLYYTVDLRRNPGERITIHYLKNGKAYHPDSTYTVATNSYVASWMGDRQFFQFLNWDKDEVHSRLCSNEMPNIVYVLYKYFKDCPNAYTPPSADERSCDFIPEEWWRIAKTRERANLNPTWIKQ